MPFHLTPRQSALRDLASGSATHVLAYGGSRSGKTFAFCYCVAVRALIAPASRHLIARLHNIDVRQSVMMDTWPKMMRLAFPGLRAHPSRQDQFLTLPNGSEVWFGGLDDPERVDKILGKEYATIYVNEASQVAYDTVATLRTRLAQACHKSDGRPLNLKAYYDLNPTGRGHWTHREFIEGVRPENGLPLPKGARAAITLNPADNPHLPPAYVAELANLPERQRRRFYEGKYLSEAPGALWPLDRLEACRVAAPPELTRIVIGVDPSGSDGSGGDGQGIVAAGLGVDGQAYVLEDASCRLPPAGWAARAVALFHKWNADLIVAEANYGGAMVAHTLRAADRNVPVRMVNAARGKHLRAEPVAALYEQGRVRHAGAFPALEEQMGLTTTSGFQGSGSPDRLDALVWCLTELMLGQGRGQAFLELARREATANPSTDDPPSPTYAVGSQEWQAAQT